MSDRSPRYDFRPKLRPYGKLDISAELVVCRVWNGQLVPDGYPKSWEEAVTMVATAEEHARLRAYADKTRTDEFREEWFKLNPRSKYYGGIAAYPTPALLLGLIPSLTDDHPYAQSRSPMDMMVHG